MTLEIKHVFHSDKGDGPDATLVQPSDWNALHQATLGVGLAGNPGPAAGPIVEIPIGGGLGFQDGLLVATVRELPIGIVMPLAGNYEPPGWLVCDGRAISRDTYAALFTITQDKFGPGDGISTFNIPDMRGRVPAGKDNLGGVAANRLTSATIPDGATDVGKIGGAERHILLAGEIPTHTHTLANTSVPHKHFVAIEGNQNDDTPSVNATETVVTSNTAGGAPYRLDGAVTPANVGITSDGTSTSHTHTMTMTGTVDQPHLNIQPTITMNYIIFTGVYPP